MARREHWDIANDSDVQMWTKIVGGPCLDEAVTREQATRLFSDLENPRLGATCLEIGAGVGRMLERCGYKFFHAMGTDWSRSMVDKSVEFLKYKEWVRVILNDGFQLPFGAKSFDFVYSVTCFQHMETLGMIKSNICEAYRVLKPGGLCRIQTVQGNRDTGEHDGYVFNSPEEFRTVFEFVGFEYMKHEVVNNWIWMTVRKPEGS